MASNLYRTYILCYSTLMRIVGCFLEFDGRFIVLLRQNHKPDGGTWCLASGKVEPGETDDAAILREVQEETGYEARQNELIRLGEYPFTASNGKDHTFIAYRIALPHKIPVTLEQDSHSEYRWVTPQECDNLPNPIPGFGELLRLVGYVSEQPSARP